MSSLNNTAKVKAVVHSVATLPRQILKWLQSLKLSKPVGRNPRREFSNGYVVAEILSKFYPQININQYDEGTSLEKKKVNWGRLKGVFARNNMVMIPEKLTEATIHCKPGAAEALIQLLHSFLTNKDSTTTLPEDCSFTDAEYQATLPHHARSTMSIAIKRNMRSSELISDPDKERQDAKTLIIMEGYNKMKKSVKKEDPGRYGRKLLDSTGNYRPFSSKLST
eukprot:m.221027 g.221027  ORF g.221027 m.221027 type:complete len:223 (+) comp15922_c0_seq18:227-895(+)